jgi:hypothetical protein
VTSYHHEQIGRVYIVTMVAGVVVALTIAVSLMTEVHSTVAGGAVFWVVGAFLALPAVAFARLTIDVRSNGIGDVAALRWSMTFGWPGGTIPIADIAHARVIPVTFWMGIGIHLSLRGWIWNVAYGQGVRVRQRDGREIVLGTDDPDGLVAAIERAREAAMPPPDAARPD